MTILTEKDRYDAVRQSVKAEGLRASSDAIADGASDIMHKLYVEKVEYLAAMPGQHPLKDLAIKLDALYGLPTEKMPAEYWAEMDSTNFSRAYVNAVRKKMQREYDRVYDLRTHKDVPDRNMHEPILT